MAVDRNKLDDSELMLMPDAVLAELNDGNIEPQDTAVYLRYCWDYLNGVDPTEPSVLVDKWGVSRNQINKSITRLRAAGLLSGRGFDVNLWGPPVRLNQKDLTVRTDHVQEPF